MHCNSSFWTSVYESLPVLGEELIGFEEITGRHTGLNLADIVFGVIKFFGVKEKVKLLSTMTGFLNMTCL